MALGIWRTDTGSNSRKHLGPEHRPKSSNPTMGREGVEPSPCGVPRENVGHSARTASDGPVLWAIEYEDQWSETEGNSANYKYAIRRPRDIRFKQKWESVHMVRRHARFSPSRWGTSSRSAAGSSGPVVLMSLRTTDLRHLRRVRDRGRAWRPRTERPQECVISHLNGCSDIQAATPEPITDQIFLEPFRNFAELGQVIVRDKTDDGERNAVSGSPVRVFGKPKVATLGKGLELQKMKAGTVDQKAVIMVELL
ncbi:hypothetical protein B0H14DRAFT_2654932 [Mycena olivaceomarginata]|nr:hypothetical protein B0H14DRAFT_2654932 [Mycena olivaceomarginata]